MPQSLYLVSVSTYSEYSTGVQYLIPVIRNARYLVPGSHGIVHTTGTKQLKQLKNPVYEPSARTLPPPPFLHPSATLPSRVYKKIRKLQVVRRRYEACHVFQVPGTGKCIGVTGTRSTMSLPGTGSTWYRYSERAFLCVFLTGTGGVDRPPTRPYLVLRVHGYITITRSYSEYCCRYSRWQVKFIGE